MRREQKNVVYYGFGSAAIDFRLETADLGAGYTEKLLARKVEMLPGGTVANCLACIARLGGRTCWLGKLGRDWIGRQIARQLDADGIDTAKIIFEDDACSPFNVAVYAGASRRRVGGWLLPNALADISAEEMESWGKWVAEGDWVLVEIGEIPLDTVLSFCRILRARGARIAIDVDLDPAAQCGAGREVIYEVLRSANILIPNRSAMKGLYGDLPVVDLAKRIYGDYGVTAVVTAGEQGAWAYDGREMLHHPALPAEIVDTVGAGDAFHGGLVWTLGQGGSLKQALETGIRCGTEACMIKGARL